MVNSFQATKTIKEYKIVEDGDDADVDTVGAISQIGNLVVQVIDPVEDYASLLATCFDFQALSNLVARPDFSLAFDAMHGAAGPAAKRILGEELGVPLSSLRNCEPREDFGGLHPDPNLVYAEEIVRTMGLDSTGRVLDKSGLSPPDFGAACDGDADRNMILGKSFFVTPSDSVAVLAANAAAIPAFAHSGLNGVARSMPTSASSRRTPAPRCARTCGRRRRRRRCRPSGAASPRRRRRRGASAPGCCRSCRASR